MQLHIEYTMLYLSSRIWKTLKTQSKTGCMHKKLFLTWQNVQRACCAVVFVEFISYGKFTAATKRVFSSMQYFTKKISGKKRERILQRYFHTANNLIWHWMQNFPNVCKFHWRLGINSVGHEKQRLFDKDLTYKRWKQKLLFFGEFISFKNSVQRWRFRLSTETWIHRLICLDNDHFSTMVSDNSCQPTLCLADDFSVNFLTLWRNSSCKHPPASHSNIFWNYTFNFHVCFITVL